ncbi:hypothetical protein LRS71_06950 [Rhodococcus pyridinivorans]|uniref:hypothetical protein n=1 Tax=Rhodococcus pyridinivorans TaxID=103816 RepID=UPI001E588A9F|nr:hypothetical protein [Rhodococcus pyridinivorans]MCD5419297.1 hypothetical protein [Rhodococcus pyridinivorans]
MSWNDTTSLRTHADQLDTRDRQTPAEVSMKQPQTPPLDREPRHPPTSEQPTDPTSRPRPADRIETPRHHQRRPVDLDRIDPADDRERIQQVRRHSQ